MSKVIEKVESTKSRYRIKTGPWRCAFFSSHLNTSIARRIFRQIFESPLETFEKAKPLPWSLRHMGGEAIP